jgi:hypothetical protein
MICLGGGVVGSLLGILWYRIVAPASLARETALFIIKLFMGIALLGVVAAVLARYIL